MNIFNFTKYRDVITADIDNNALIHGYQGKLALAAGCSKSYFSQMLSSNVQLTPEHGAGLVNFWKLNEDESEYFLVLLLLERSSSRSLTLMLERKLKILKIKNIRFKRTIKSDFGSDPEKMLKYYSSWLYPAIHVPVSIPDLQTVSKLVAYLGIAPEIINRVLGELQSLGLVAEAGGRFSMINKNIHTSEDSPMSALNHANFRQKTILEIQQGKNEGIHYTGVHSLSFEDCVRVQEFLVESVSKIRAIITPSKEEELVCFSIDFYPLRS